MSGNSQAARPIVIHAFGSRGDVHPSLALGRGLRSRGHRVRVVTSARYAPAVVATGLEHVPLSFDFEAVLKSPPWQTWHDGKGRSAIERDGRRAFVPVVDTMLAEVQAACVGARALLTPSFYALGHALSESCGISCAFTQMQPLEPTRAFPALTVCPSGSWGPWANLASYTLTDQFAWQQIRRGVNRWRASLGLPPLSWWDLPGPFARARRQGLPVLCGFSSHVVPRPADWGPNVHVTGYWVDPPPASWAPPEELAAFLEAGPPPVYVGFGSWEPGDASEVHRLAVAALRHAGMRGVLGGRAAEGDDPGRYGPDMFVVGQVSHEWLFPHCAAVVHQGGAGTTATGLRAGVTNVVIPLLVDQPFWAARVAALGAGPAPVPVKGLRPEVLGEAVRVAVTDPRMRTAAAELGRKLRAERGVEQACDVIEDWLHGLESPDRESRRLAGRPRRHPAHWRGSGRNVLVSGAAGKEDDRAPLA